MRQTMRWNEKITGEMESYCREDDGVPLQFWMDEEMKMVMEQMEDGDERMR